MAKQPYVGITKTRLSPPLTPDEAAALYEVLLLDTIALVSGQEGCDLALAISPPESRLYFEKIAPIGTILLPVDCTDIGDCLMQALDRLLRMGYYKALALNADGPSLPQEYLKMATDLLDDQDVVFGPARDGGYYLVGMKQLHTGVFDGIAWSTDQVMSQTLNRVKSLGLRLGLTPEWYDVDTALDILSLKAELKTLPEDRLVFTRLFWAGLDLERRLG